MNNMPLISVIIPVYNTEKYVKQCVESLLNQTYKNYEVLLVDDGSLDKSLKVCEEYNKYDNISTYHKQNGGLSSARNFGIQHARGEYLLFLDSDDWFESDMIENFTMQILEKRYDVVIQGFQVDFENESMSYYQQFLNDLSSNSNELGNILVEVEKVGLFNSSCNKLYKRKIIQDNNIYFLEGKEPAEDLLFNCEYFQYINSICCIKYSGYHYIKRNMQSLTVKYIENYDKKILEYNEARKKLYKVICMPESKINEILKDSLSSYTLTAISNIYRKNSPLTFKERSEILRRMFENQEIRYATLNSKYSNIFIKLIRLGIKAKYSTIANLLFTLTYWGRYKFEHTYVRLRQKVLYSKGGN